MENQDEFDQISNIVDKRVNEAIEKKLALVEEENHKKKLAEENLLFKKRTEELQKKVDELQHSLTTQTTEKHFPEPNTSSEKPIVADKNIYDSIAEKTCEDFYKQDGTIDSNTIYQDLRKMGIDNDKGFPTV